MNRPKSNNSISSWTDISSVAPKFYYKQVDERLDPSQYQGNYPPNIPTLHYYMCYEEQQGNDNNSNEYTLKKSGVNNNNNNPFIGDNNSDAIYNPSDGAMNNNNNNNPPSMPTPQIDTIIQKDNNLISMPFPQTNNNNNNPQQQPNPPSITMPIPQMDLPNNNPLSNNPPTMTMPTPWQDSEHGNYSHTQPAPMQASNFVPMPQPEHQDEFIAPPQLPPVNPNSFQEPPSLTPVPQHAPLPPGAPNVVQVSNFTGRKKALLIGINYIQTKFELKGCINDVKNIQRFLTSSYQFPLEGMVLLTDDQRHNPSRLPTKQNILSAMRWLTDGARANDSLFFHFSGHGSQTPDLDGDEEDGFDETICPLDFQQQGQITDDEMNLILVQPLPQGCRLTAVFDCCHSGTALDLPYIYSSSGKLKSFNPAKSAFNTLVSIGTKTQMGDLVGAMMSLKDGVNSVMHGHKREKQKQELKGGLADVIMFSGCKDEQTSADVNDVDLGNTGAMSMALITALYRRSYNLSYIDLLHQIRTILAEKKYTQIPQLSTARPMDMNSIFRM
ncbi:hypothetical protein K502DRAFT_324411 [Neoconidiobolus thromboides FSU 785]|nr:hypothetical protein K502DRAFT_324411 [Neoconidiobolus thromboides FSU 785]